jgi:DNA gyrase/topoisomerase IV subunit A
MAIKKFLFGALLISSGCTPSSMEEYRREGEALCRSFTHELQKIESREDLVRASPKIKQHYEEIVQLIIEAQNFKNVHSQEAIEAFETSDMLASEELMMELKRIYRMEGGKELMENAQKEALFRLSKAVQGAALK